LQKAVQRLFAPWPEHRAVRQCISLLTDCHYLW
jgi:hypothetical protein